jgi:hypothetical protein
MLRSICDKKGMGLIEVVIAIFLTTVGILAVLSMQPSAWRAAGKADYLGRASGILSKTLEDNESWIMNPCNAVTLSALDGDNNPIPTTTTVRVSGAGAGLSGDMTYTIATAIAQDGTNTSAFVVTVKVTWATNATGITESLTVARQELNRFPAGCTSA